jgi:hypothetical protein
MSAQAHPNHLSAATDALSRVIVVTAAVPAASDGNQSLEESGCVLRSRA